MLGVLGYAWIHRLIDMEVEPFLHRSLQQTPYSEAGIHFWWKGNTFHGEENLYAVSLNVD
jgi:hypothetical protein